MDNNMRCFEYFQLTPEVKERLKPLEIQFHEKIYDKHMDANSYVGMPFNKSVDELLGCIHPSSERCSERIYEEVFLAAAEAEAGDKHPVRAWCLRQLKKGTIVSDSWKEAGK